MHPVERLWHAAFWTFTAGHFSSLCLASLIVRLVLPPAIEPPAGT